MKIGINAIFFAPGEGGGIERYLRNLLRALQKIDRKNDYVLFTNKDNKGTFCLADSFKEYRVPISARSRIMKILWEQIVFPLQVRQARVDVLLSPGNIAPILLHCPSAVVIHDLIPFMWPQNFSRRELAALRTLFTATARASSRIITVSKSSQKQIMRQFNISRERVCVIHEACDEHFSTDGDSTKEKRLLEERFDIKRDFILYTAATRPHKNVSGLLKAFSHARNRFGIEHMLVIAGPPGSEHGYLLELTKKLELNEHVIFTGYVSDGMLPALYRSASLFVYPSLYEGFGLPVLEAMASGTPVVASNTTSLPEVVGNAGTLVSPHHCKQLAAAMYKVLSDDEYRFDLVALGKKRVRAFSWEKTAEQVLGLLEALC